MEDARIRGRHFQTWTDERKQRVLSKVLHGSEEEFDDDCKLFWNTFNAKAHVDTVHSHRKFIKKVYDAFGEKFPLLNRSIIEQHDLSKYSFIEIVGYTDKWIHRENSECWEIALQHHYDNNGHHPQHHRDGINEIDMPRRDLEESVVDMLACRWERELHGREEMTYEEVAYIRDSFLGRYTENDREIVKTYLSTGY